MWSNSEFVGQLDRLPDLRHVLDRNSDQSPDQRPMLDDQVRDLVRALFRDHPLQPPRHAVAGQHLGLAAYVDLARLQIVYLAIRGIRRSSAAQRPRPRAASGKR